jgi:hypothetical protein
MYCNNLFPLRLIIQLGVNDYTFATSSLNADWVTSFLTQLINRQDMVITGNINVNK